MYVNEQVCTIEEINFGVNATINAVELTEQDLKQLHESLIVC